MKCGFFIALLALVAIECCNASADDTDITVTTIMQEPYTMWKTRYALGNERFQGFIPDLMEAISTETGLKYTFKVVDDQRYGYRGARGQWTGMIGEVITGRADLAAAPLTMTSSREEVVDFTYPITNVGLSFLYKKPLPFSSLEEAVEQAEAGSLTLGTLRGGSTYQFFKNGPDGLAKRIWNVMSQSDQNVVSTMDAGIQKVLRGNYAFIVESSFAEYVVTRRAGCAIGTIGTGLRTRFYGLATRRGSALRNRLSTALLRLQEDGTLEELHQKWWRNQCPASEHSPAVHRPHLKITTIMHEPLVKMAAGEHTGNARFEGFIPDYLHELSELVGFDYTLQLVKDGKWGGSTDDGKWYGMIGEVVRGEADMAASALTITSTRQQVVDFTNPIANVARTALVKKSSEITSLEQLATMAEEGKISIAAFRGSSTMSYLKNTRNPLHQRLGDAISEANMLTNLTVAIEKVQQGGYAFISSSRMLEFFSAKDCDLATVGSFANTVDAFALPKGSKYRERINRAMLKLQENGKLYSLYVKHFKAVNNIPCTL